jgi:hypothetical protein
MKEPNFEGQDRTSLDEDVGREDSFARGFVIAAPTALAFWFLVFLLW